jgi:hypothetical protein
MFKKTSKLRKVASLMAMATGLVAILGTTPAFASTVVANVALVQYYTPPSTQTPNTLLPQLILQSTSSVNYFALVGGYTSCAGNLVPPAPNPDTIKLWQSLGEAALLSGKTVQIDYVVCNNLNAIYAVTLKQ